MKCSYFFLCSQIKKVNGVYVDYIQIVQLSALFFSNPYLTKNIILNIFENNQGIISIKDYLKGPQRPGLSNKLYF